MVIIRRPQLLSVMHLSRKCSLSSCLKQRKLKVFNCSSISISSQGSYVEIHACTNGERYGIIVLLGGGQVCRTLHETRVFRLYFANFVAQFQTRRKNWYPFSGSRPQISFIYPTAHSNIYPMMISDQRLACFSKGVTAPSPSHTYSVPFLIYMYNYKTREN